MRALGIASLVLVAQMGLFAQQPAGKSPTEFFGLPPGAWRPRPPAQQQVLRPFGAPVFHTPAGLTLRFAEPWPAPSGSSRTITCSVRLLEMPISKDIDFAMKQVRPPMDRLASMPHASVLLACGPPPR